MERRIVVEGREILYELTAKKVKNLNLRVRPDGRVAVSVPRRLSPDGKGGGGNSCHNCAHGFTTLSFG